GFLPQDFSYYPDFTGMKFMLYIAALKGINKNLAKKRCLELLTLVGLEDVKNKKIKKYSGGMKQRLGIAQAMINDPEVL
ncbi:ATP-binding cassette domain-containing protein, partial [Bacillus sp. SIMBA_005]